MSKVAELKAVVGRAELLVAEARDRHRMAEDALREAMIAETPRTAGDYRLRIVGEDSMWLSTEAMLDDVLGDHDPLVCCGADWRPHYESKKEWKAACDAVVAQTEEYREAYENGNGVFAFGGILEERDPLTGEWEETDSCFGFYTLDGSAPESDIAEQVLNVPEGVVREDVEIVYES